MYKIGFIGAGNMGQAIANGIVKSNKLKAEDIILSDLNNKVLHQLKKVGFKTTLDNNEVASTSELLVLAIEPSLYQKVIGEIMESLATGVVIISITPNFTLKDLELMFNKPTKIIRTMPNTPALVQAAMIAYVTNQQVTKNDITKFLDFFTALGKVEEVKENIMDAVMCISGSSPAYAFMMIEAMADAAVLHGMNRDQAYTFAAQALLGSAKMVLETKLHPGVLKDMVCSPGGTTIEAVAVLEEEGFRNSIIKAMNACVNKNKK